MWARNEREMYLFVIVRQLPDSAEEGVDGVGVGGVGGERVADLVAEGCAVFLERVEGSGTVMEEASRFKEISKAPLQLHCTHHDAMPSCHPCR